MGFWMKIVGVVNFISLFGLKYCIKKFVSASSFQKTMRVFGTFCLNFFFVTFFWVDLFDPGLRTQLPKILNEMLTVLIAMGA